MIESNISNNTIEITGKGTLVERINNATTVNIENGFILCYTQR